MRLDRQAHCARRPLFVRGLTDTSIASLGRGDAVHFDNALEDDVAARVRATALRMDAHGALRAAGVGPDAATHPEIRGDQIAWLDPSNPPAGLAPVVSLFEDLMQALNETAYLGARRLECQVAVYHEGHGYQRHRDATTSDSSRRATAIYYANDWHPGDGGELEVWEDPGSRVLAPLSDRMVFFRSQCTEHAVRPVVGAPRVAVSAFMHND
ncbi:MAG: 2OG-Fe(II) oxygenase [Nannocystaceae bacterium]|nr:2OG-Fe(II) oxygenase [Nannocystaceae bacterium]